MAKEWTDDEVQKEIADAIAIVREDRFEKFARETLGKGGNPNPGDPPTPTPPTGNPNDPPKGKRGLWWGEPE
jgi:hypothetical protein